MFLLHFTDSYIAILFFFIALIYSSVGFGGGSSYLAILSLFEVPFTHVRAIALICNITVVSGNVFNYQKKEIIDWKQFIPFMLSSIPFAFFGGYWRIERQVFFIMLGVSLLLASILLLWQSRGIKSAPSRISHPLINFLLGGFIGFLSGVVGIGGGVFLSPILHLMNWDTPIKIAALSSVFILFNSIAGLAGQWMHPLFSLPLYELITLVMAVALGSAIGRHISFHHFTPKMIRRVTGVLVGVLALRILWIHLL